MHFLFFVLYIVLGTVLFLVLNKSFKFTKGGILPAVISWVVSCFIVILAFRLLGTIIRAIITILIIFVIVMLIGKLLSIGKK